MGLITLASAVLPMASRAVYLSTREAAGPLKWSLLFPAVFAANLLVATLAWVLVALLLN